MEKKEFSILNLTIEATNFNDYEIILFDSNRTFADSINISNIEAGLKYWTLKNELYYAIDNFSYGEFVIINCINYNYRSLIEALKTKKIFIKKIRITTASINQLLEPFTIINKDIFGGSKEVDINPNFSPLQVQNNIIDVNFNVEINSDKGIKYKILGSNPQKFISLDILCSEI